MCDIEKSEITWQFATEHHGKLIWDIFNGVNMIKYSPVFDIPVEGRAEQLKKNAKSFTENADFYRLIYSYKNKNVGTVVLKNISIEFGSKIGEIGFGLLDEWQNKGLGPIIINNFINQVFKYTDIDCLWATISFINKNAKKCLENIGFSFFGNYHKPYLIQGEYTEQHVYKKYRNII